MQVNLENSKYSLIFDETTGTLLANRYGEYWMDYSGNKFVYLLLARIVELESKQVQQGMTPMTDEEILAIGKELGKKCRLGGNPNIDFDYARAIESHHGIK